MIQLDNLLNLHAAKWTKASLPITNEATYNIIILIFLSLNTFLKVTELITDIMNVIIYVAVQSIFQELKYETTVIIISV